MIRIIIVSMKDRNILDLRTCLKANFPRSLFLCGFSDNMLDAVSLCNENKPHIVIIGRYLMDEIGLNWYKYINMEGGVVIYLKGEDEEIEEGRFGIDFVCFKRNFSMRELNNMLKAVVLRVQKKMLNAGEREGQANDILTVWESEKLKQIKMADIIKIKSDGSYSNIHLVNKKKIVSCKNLGIYEDLLRSLDFIRIHKSCIINLSHIRLYTPGVRAYVTMSDSDIEYVSKNKKRRLLNYLNKID